MADYEKQTWANKPSQSTPVTKARMDHIENGIFTAQETADDAYALALAGGGGGGGGGSIVSVNGDTGPAVSLNQDEIPDGTTYKQYSQTEKTKLAAIASSATANSSDATLLARANHTGTQAISTVTGLQTALDGKAPVIADPNADRLRGWDDSAGAEVYFTLGTNLSITGTTLNASGGGGGGTAAPIFYPEDFGAVGDGTTSDETALQDCKTAALAAGGVMWLSAGRRYRQTATLSYTNESVQILGDGRLVQAPGLSSIYSRHEPTDTITVTGISTGFVGPATSNDVAKPSNTVTKIDAAAASMVKFQAGEPWLIRSQDVYPWSFRNGGSSTEYPVSGRVWLQDWVKILGVVIPYTTAGAWTVREGDTITGVTSGATAQVIATHTDQLVVRDVVGTFTTSENLNVAGALGATITGAAWVALTGVVDDAFATSIVMERMRPDLDVNIAVGIDTYTDTDDVLGSSARKDSIQIVGAISPKIKVDALRTYGAAVQVATCFQPEVNLTVRRAPNIVVSGGSSSNIATEGGYGYGVEALGAVAEGVFNIRATSVRHAFTTNPFEFSSGTYPTTVTNKLLTGVGRDNVVSGVAAECYSDGFNTHEGSKRTHFLNCVNSRSLSGGRYQSGTKGFENRGLATKYTNCFDYGSSVSFWDSSMGHRTGGFIDETTYTNCVAEDFQEIGFNQSQAAYVGDVHRRRYFGCRARGNGSARPSSSPNTQKAYSLSGTETELHFSKASRFNADAILISAGGASTQTISILNFEADFRDCPNTSSTNLIRVFGSNFRIIVGDISVWQNPTYTTHPNHIIRATSGTPTILFAGSQRTINTDNPIPRYLTSSGTPTYGYVIGEQPRQVTSSTAPTGDLLTGDTWIDTATDTMKRYTGSGWTSVSGSGGGTSLVAVRAITASDTLVLADAGKAIEATHASTGIVVTVPPNSSVAFPIGTVIEVGRFGAAAVTIAAGAGVTINSAGGLLAARAQYSSMSLRKRGTDLWQLAGDLA